MNYNLFKVNFFLQLVKIFNCRRERNKYQQKKQHINESKELKFINRSLLNIHGLKFTNHIAMSAGES